MHSHLSGCNLGNLTHLDFCHVYVRQTSSSRHSPCWVGSASSNSWHWELPSLENREPQVKHLIPLELLEGAGNTEEAVEAVLIRLKELSRRGENVRS